jgi:hypothetical protein
MHRVVIQPSFDRDGEYKRKSAKLRLYFDDAPTMKAVLYAIDEERFGDPKNKLFYKNCKMVVMEMGVPILGPYRSNTSCCVRGIVSLRRLKVYKST